MWKTNIALIGCMGCGKTTVGRLLAAKSGMAFLDTDDGIETRTHKKIPYIFEHYGESYFRALESEMIAEAVQMKNTIIATGGGAVLDKKNMDALALTSVIVYLEQPNLRTGDKARPLLNTADPPGRLRELMEERAPLYRQAADQIIACQGKSPERIVEEILWI